MFKFLKKYKTSNIILCEDCYFPKLNIFLREKYPEIWDDWVREGIKNLELQKLNEPKVEKLLCKKEHSVKD